MDCRRCARAAAWPTPPSSSGSARKGPGMTVIRAAAVQMSPVLYSREGIVERVTAKIAELALRDVQFAPFPETVNPCFTYFSFVSRPFEMRSEHLKVMHQAVTPPSPEIDAIGAAPGGANMVVSIG